MTLIGIRSVQMRIMQQDTYYNVAEATWENMQQEIKQWINSPISNGGQATVKPKKAVRVNRTHIIALLTATETIDQIPSICN